MPREQRLLARLEVVPRLDVVVQLGVARRELHALRHDARRLLAGEALVAQRIPTRVVAAAVALDVLRSRVQRRVHRTVREVEQERLARIRGLGVPDHRDGPVGDVVGEVVVVRVLIDVDEVVVLHDHVRVVQVRERAEEPVVAIEAALARPRVARPRG